ncbi:MAG: hypothetical protein EAZ97_15530 [Bacteroidetes bacterium]|nr:MAG: hypothetical protein EAZ97_15530 [Bacteroidota bacterium]
MKKIKVLLSLLVFKENDLYFVYSPTLDITGYDYSKKGAKESFKEVLSFFLEHNLEQGTLHKELERLGWNLKQAENPIPPNLKQIVRHNKNFNELYEKQMKKQIRSMAMQSQNIELQLA